MKKKVLFMVTTMDVGGVEKSLLSLLSVLPKEKYDITIMFLNKQGEFLKAIPDWVKTEEVDWFTKVWSLIRQSPPKTFREYLKRKRFLEAFNFGLIYFLSRELKNRILLYRYYFQRVPKNPKQYDIAIAYQGPTEVIDYYIINKVRAKKKISWVHFDVSKHFIDQGLYKKLYRKFDKIYVVSHEAREQLINRIPNLTQKTEVFLNIVSEKIIKNLSTEKIEFDEEYKGTRILTVGRIAHEKGQDIAVKVLAKLRNAGYEVRWYCVGGKEYKHEYEKLTSLINHYGLSDHFILLGPKLNPYPYISKTNLYVQPSRHDVFCNLKGYKIAMKRLELCQPVFYYD
ncbi:glycosyltransferase [Oceanobacillus sojae]|uniref:glycosyltransferase n=1 Tax=Oceanobacillus sojae TaxID=582851 RepID=UPI000988854F|nr:glycosyltransferase [Oceanobacillus sojae]